MSDLLERLEQLPPAQRALLAKRLNLLGGGRNGIPKRPQVENAPLSYSQERLWFLEQLYPGLPINNIVGVNSVHGDFDADTFYRALGLIIARHESLRTMIFTSAGKPCQQIAPPTEPVKIIHDISHLPADERKIEADAIFAREAKHCFDLSGGLLLRAVILRLAPLEHKILICMHHIASDGWSTSILLREAIVFYNHYKSGYPLDLPALPIQYSDYAVWQRNKTGGAQSQKHLDYWLEHLRGMPPLLELPTDKIRPGIPSHQGARVALDVSPEIADRLRDFAIQENATPFMVLLAVYVVLLQRYSGQEDFAIGVPIAGREHQETEGLIGCFLNMLALRFDVSREPKFNEFLSHVKYVVLSAFEHSETPFETVISQLSPDRDTRYSPLFQVSFSYEREPADSLFSPQPDLAISFDEMHLGVARYDISLELTSGKHGMQGWIDFNADIFHRDTIKRMVEHFLILLADALQNPTTLIGTLNILPEYERQTLLVDWNQTQVAYPREATVPELFSRIASLYPNSTAVVENSRRLSYGELARRANALAKQFTEMGVRGGTPIALCVERSVEAIVAILAILKTGGAYAPIDPARPQAQILGMLADMGTELLLLTPMYFERFQNLEGIRLIVLDGDNANHVPEPAPIETIKIAATDTAYIMFSSGSTGLPKGVAVSHRNIVRLVRDTNYACFGPEEVGLLLAPLAFDASTFEIWGQLLNGGTLCIAQPGILGFDQIADTIRRYGVTTLWLTSGLFQGMVEEEIEGLRPLKQLLTGGDVLPKVQVAKFMRAIPDCRLINGYGPTECTTFTCCHDIIIADTEGPSIPIGRPIANTTVYVLDKYLQPAPIGVPGELFIGGDGVASGYVNQPGLTAERFVPDPYHDTLNARMYRSGDRVRFLSDGRIEFLGRLDQQVKLRGFRIELGEIEAVLSVYSGVRESAVALREDGPGGSKRLCAYLVMATPAQTDIAQVREFLKERLPDYMIPATFTIVPGLPISPNGKVDKRRLPAPDEHPTKGAVKPEGEMEKKLALLWEDVLQIHEIGRYDNFFELGGDSIRVVQLVARANRDGLGLSALDVFSYQTLGEMAAAARPNLEKTQAQERPSGDVPLVPIQNWFFAQECPNRSHWNQWLVFKLPDKIPLETLESALRLVADRYDAFRLRFRREGEGWAQFLVDECAIGIEQTDFSAIAVDQRRAALADMANALNQRLDIVQGPVLRALLIRGLEEGGIHVLLIAHHLVIDQISWYVLLEDLQASAEASTQAASESASAQSQSSSFTHWSRYLTANSTTTNLEAWSKYWLSFAWREPQLFPLDFPDGLNTEADAKVLTWEGEPKVVNDLKLARRSFQLRIDDYLAIALALALREWTGGETVQIDVESAGRSVVHDEIDISRSIGWFTNLYPVPLQPATQDLSCFIKESKERLRRCADHGLSFGLLRYNALGVGLIKDIPKSQFVFNFLGEIDERIADMVEFGISADTLVKARDPDAHRSHAIVIDALIVAGRLRMSWIYSSALHRPETMDALARCFSEKLDELNAYCLSPNIGGRTPVDFPHAALEQGKLDELFDRILGAEIDVTSNQLARIEDIYPLTSLQEGLLFHALSVPDSDNYLVQLICHMEGQLDTARFEQAWQIILARHPALRTGFHHENLQSPLQVVERVKKIPWKFTDLSDLAEQDKEESFRNFLNDDRMDRFDLASPPLMRMHILNFGKASLKLVWTYHHLILDGWSMAIVLREVFIAYKALSTGGYPKLPPVRPYRDFIVRLQTQDRASAKAVWRDELQGFAAPTPLPAQTPPHGSATTAIPAEIRLEMEATTALIRNIQAKRLTLATVLQGVWALLLGAYSGNGDVVFGSTVSGRTIGMDGLESMVGLFINTVPQRVHIDLDSALDDWFTRIQARQTELREHEWCALTDIQGVSKVPRGYPLFESVVVIENYPMETGQAGEERSLWFSGFETIENIGFPLTLMAIPEDKLRLKLFYDPQRFSSSHIEKLLGRVVALLLNVTRAWQSSLEGILQQESLPLPNTSRDFTTANVRARIIPEQFTLPIGELETKISEIWAELLDIETCGVENDFYALGGHSLLIMRMRTRILERLGKDVSVVDILQYPTVRSLAKFIAQSENIGNQISDVLQRAEGRKERAAMMRRAHSQDRSL